MDIAITLECSRVNDLYHKADELGANVAFSDRYNKGYDHLGRCYRRDSQFYS